MATPDNTPPEINWQHVADASNKEVLRLLNKQDDYEAAIDSLEATMAQQQETIAQQADAIEKLNAVVAERVAVIRILGRML